jgi:hypothetical protein
MKLVELAIVQIIDNVENEKTLSMLTFMTLQFYNHLVGHLNIVIQMITHDFLFIKKFFPFQVTIIDWNDEDKVRVGINEFFLIF